MGGSTHNVTLAQGNADASMLSTDELQLRAQGHKGEMPRQFSAFATLSMAFSITNSWIGYSATFAYPYSAGGGPTVIFGLVLAAVASTVITAGLAEIASAFPSSGGQYHFAYMVSPPKIRAPVAFFMGWFSVIAWALTSASAVILGAQICATLASYYHPAYTATQWQIWVMAAVFMIIATAAVCLLPKFLPRAETGFFLCSLIGIVVFTITVLATSSPKQPGSVVFTDWVNTTGWSDGTAFLLGTGSCSYAFLGTDAATHISEELPNPGRNVPRVMMLTMLTGFITALVWTVAFMFSTNDLETVTTALLPIYTVYLQALGNGSAATFFLCWVLWIFVGAMMGCIATAGRLAWAFARDGGLPFSKKFAKVHPTQQMPVNATIACAVFVILYTLIYIGSTTAFNSIISLSVLSLNVTYAIPQGIVLVYGRDKVLPDRPYNLGPYLGPFCNVFSCLWVAVYSVLYCFPVVLPPQVDNMNYLSVVLVGFLLIIAILWFTGKRKSFTGPNIDLDGIELPPGMVTNNDSEGKEAQASSVAGTSI